MGLTFKTKSGNTIPDTCSRCKGSARLGTLKMVNGKLQAAYFCERCGSRGESIRETELQANRVDIANLPTLQDNSNDSHVIERRSVWDERKNLECPKCEEVPTLVRVSKNGLYSLGWACPGCGGYLQDVGDEWAELDSHTAGIRPIYSDFRRGRMPYDEYLEDPWWKRVSWAAKWLAQGKCQLCNYEAHYTGTDWLGLHAHHNNYARRGHESPLDLIVLCSLCHGRFHETEL